MGRAGSKLVRISKEAGALLSALRGEIESKVGFTMTEGNTVQRSLLCLQDAIHRRAWLSPKEAGPVLNKRHQEGVTLVLIQFAKQLGRVVDRVEFTDKHCRVFLVLAEGQESQPVMLPYNVPPKDPKVGKAGTFYPEGLH